ncbi:MAG: RNA polymerase sporulation sigma factor SigK [Bacilli bacterium]|nr:RNA polymerase sporulation sigma factor SigK [Bacilli bacterium]
MSRLIRLLKRLFYKVSSVFYVGATDVLPEPLTKEEEDYFLKLKESGDNNAKEKLIEHNLRLVVFLAKKYENTGVELEDLVSIGSIGLIKGINTFSSDKNIKLATYCSRCIDNEILMYLRKNKKLKNEVSIDQTLSYDTDGNELRLEDIIGTDKDEIAKEIEVNDDKELIIREILSLKPRDREIMILRYGLLGNNEYTQKEVADKLHISQSYISRIEKKVIKKLKVLINN